MKQIVIIFFAFIFSLSAHSQVNNLEDGDKCFTTGNYTCALTKYKDQYKSANVNDKMDIEIKIQQVKLCIENLKNANLAFNSKNYTKAKELYLALLDSNPNDTTAKSQLEIINTFLSKPKTTTLSLSKTDISFDSSGGSSNISVDTNYSSYIINFLPSWCTVQKYDKYFVINCSKYNGSTSRKDYFNVISGDKTIRVNVVQQGTSLVKEDYLNVSKTNLAFTSKGGYDEVRVTTNSIDFTASWFPSWCIINKYKDYVAITCLSNDSSQSRSDWFKITAGNKEVKVYVNQEAANTNSSSESIKTTRKKLGPFSSIGFQSGEIANFGIIYETGSNNNFGYRFALRSSLASNDNILNGKVKKNKTELEVGINYNLYKQIYLNFGIGYGYYKRLLNNDYLGNITTKNIGYFVTTTGIMYRLDNRFNINCGLAFMDIYEDIYKPELTFGVTYNIKKITEKQTNTYSKSIQKKEKKYYKSLSSFSSLGFYGGKNAKYGLFYETGGNSVIGFHISARTSLKEETIINGQLNLNRSELVLGPNFRMSNKLYLNLGVGYGIYDYGLSSDIYMDTDDYFTANVGIMFRVSKVININAGYSFENFDIEYDKPEMTFGISFNIWD